VAGASGTGTWRGLRSVAGSWRLASVALLSFSSGLPLGLVWLAIPAWMARAGVDIRVIGLFTLAQAPWSFKLLWSPWMDRYAPPLLGRKRGGIVLSQVALVALGLWLSGVSDHPEAVWVIGALALAIAFASATQDIAIDAYAVEALERGEQGIATGARTAFYRAAMLVAGGVSITLAAETSWAFVNLLLALVYVPFMVVAALAPEPEALPLPPRTLKEAVWGPFVGFLAQHRSLEILAFVVLYKLSDNLTQALTRPFLVQVGFGDFDVGVATATIGQAAAILGTFVGGLLTDRIGLGRALWVFGFLQMASNLGYAAVAQAGVNRPLMYAAQAFELGSSGLGSGAFGVLLLRLTQKRFSATQYALLSSLFTLPRVLAGPVAGVLADAMGWRDFFVLTVVFGVPGMVMLGRFVPWHVRDVEFAVLAPARGRPLSRGALLRRSLAGGLATLAIGLAGVLLVAWLTALRAGRGLDAGAALVSLVRPASVGVWTTTAGLVVLSVLGGLGTAATLAARRGIAPVPDRPE
jgi:PAT family beta-lactamase induction signal transducer AmpG